MQSTAATRTFPATRAARSWNAGFSALQWPHLRAHRGAESAIAEELLLLASPAPSTRVGLWDRCTARLAALACQ